MLREIRSGRLTGIELLGFWVAAAAITALIAAFLPNPVHRLEIPVVDDVLEATRTMGLIALVYAPLHLAFRRGHRSTSFREYLLTTLAIGALLYPWIALSHGMLMLAGLETPMYVTGPVTLVFYVRAYAELYGRSVWRTAAWLIPCMIGMALAMVAVVAAVLFAMQRL